MRWHRRADRAWHRRCPSSGCASTTRASGARGLGRRRRPAGPVGVLLGPLRANRKPVAPGRRPRRRDTRRTPRSASRPLTRELVRAEADGLATLAEGARPRSRRPGSCATGGWRGLNGPRHQSPAGAGAAAGPPASRWTRPVSCSCGARTLARPPLDRVPLLGADRFPPATPREHGLADLAALRDRLMTVIGSTRLPLGASPRRLDAVEHGRGPRQVEVWDWERYATGVPAGLRRRPLRRVPGDRRRATARPGARSWRGCRRRWRLRRRPVDPPAAARDLPGRDRRALRRGSRGLSLRTAAERRLAWVLGLLDRQLDGLAGGDRR